MQIVLNSKRYDQLLKDVGKLYRFEGTSDQYDTGIRDGRNDVLVEIETLLSEFWKDITS